MSAAEIREVTCRPMTAADVPAAAAVHMATSVQAAERRREDYEEPPADRLARFHRTLERFATSTSDHGPLAFVAEIDGEVVGYSAAIREDHLWGLALLFVHPDHQSRGIGRQLLDHALRSAEGATVRLIQSSDHPLAARRYALAGLRLHPAVGFRGTVDRTRLPAEVPGRDGSLDDLGLVDHVDREIRGPSRSPHVAFVTELGMQLHVVDDPTVGLAWAVANAERGPGMLGATTAEAARAVLWRCLAHTDADATIQVEPVCAEHQWMVEVCLAAGLEPTWSTPMFIDGWDRPPELWLPSGIYF